jgi:hypothetical protein
MSALILFALAISFENGAAFRPDLANLVHQATALDWTDPWSGAALLVRSPPRLAPKLGLERVDPWSGLPSVEPAVATSLAVDGADPWSTP